MPGQTKKKATYIYAVISCSEDRIYGPFGIEGEKVYAVSDGRVAAVVSDLISTKIRPERRHLAAHQEVLKRLMVEGTPLPMTFGIMAGGIKEIRQILSLNRKAFLEQLDRVAGKVEMGLKVIWDVPNIFEHFVLTHSELRVARDRFLGANREPAQEDKIQLGRMFDSILNEDRDALTERVEEVLSLHCFEIKHNPLRNERDVMNLACLVGNDTQSEFESGVLEAAGFFDNNFSFDYNGPWAPHNFIDIDLKVEHEKAEGE